MVKKRRGIAAAVTIWLVTLLLMTVLYIPMNFAMSQAQSWQQANYGSGYILPDVATGFSSIWMWLLIIVFLAGIPFVYREAQRQRNYE